MTWILPELPVCFEHKAEMQATLMSLQDAVKDLPSARILLASDFENGPKIDP
jgi:hypothetical protein